MGSILVFECSLEIKSMQRSFLGNSVASHQLTSADRRNPNMSLSKRHRHWVKVTVCMWNKRSHFCYLTQLLNCDACSVKGDKARGRSLEELRHGGRLLLAAQGIFFLFEFCISLVKDGQMSGGTEGGKWMNQSQSTALPLRKFPVWGFGSDYEDCRDQQEHWLILLGELNTSDGWMLSSSCFCTPGHNQTSPQERCVSRFKLSVPQPHCLQVTSPNQNVLTGSNSSVREPDSAKTQN